MKIKEYEVASKFEEFINGDEDIAFEDGVKKIEELTGCDFGELEECEHATDKQEYWTLLDIEWLWGNILFNYTSGWDKGEEPESLDEFYETDEFKNEGHWSVYDYTNKSLGDVCYSNASDTATIEEIFEKGTLDNEDEAEVFLMHAIDENGYNHDGELDALSCTIKHGFRYLDVDRCTKCAYNVKLIVEATCYKNPDDDENMEDLYQLVFYKSDDYYVEPNLRYYVIADEPLTNIYDIEPNGGDALTYAEAVKLFNRIAEYC